jgi:hypothetical protein
MVKVTVIAKPPRLEPVGADPFIADLTPAPARPAGPGRPAARPVA